MNIVNQFPSILPIGDNQIQVFFDDNKFRFDNENFWFYNICFQEKIFIFSSKTIDLFYVWSPLKIEFKDNGCIKNEIYFNQSKLGFVGLLNKGVGRIKYELDKNFINFVDLMIDSSENLLSVKEKEYINFISKMPASFARTAFLGKISIPNKSLFANQKEGVLYLVELDGCLKIGFSTNIDERLKAYKTSSFIVKLLAIRSSNISEEKAIHKKINNSQEKYAKDRLEELLKLFTKI
ncbi:MAG: hypothetical protein ACRDBG_08375 [Waterburya sp.]